MEGTYLSIYIPGVPVLKVNIYIFEFQKKMEEKIILQKFFNVYNYRVISN